MSLVTGMTHKNKKFQKMHFSKNVNVFFLNKWIYNREKALVDSGLYNVGDSLDFTFDSLESEAKL